jgi:hypothetical protein
LTLGPAWPVGNYSCRRVWRWCGVPFCAPDIASARQGAGNIRCNAFLRQPGSAPTLFFAPNPAQLAELLPSLLHPGPRPARDPALACTLFRVCTRFRCRALASSPGVPAGGFAVEALESSPFVQFSPRARPPARSTFSLREPSIAPTSADAGVSLRSLRQRTMGHPARPEGAGFPLVAPPPRRGGPSGTHQGSSPVPARRAGL